MRRPLLLAFWLATDIILFIAAYALAYFLRVGWIFSSDIPFIDYLKVIIAVAPLWLLSLATTRTFALTRSQKSMRNVAYIVYACVVGTALVALIYYFAYQQIFSRLILLLGFAGSTVAIWLWHLIFEELQKVILRRSPPAFPTLIVGVTRESRRLLEKMERNRNPLKPVAILDATGVKETEICGVPVRGKLNKLEEILTAEKITHLIQCSDMDQSFNLLNACRARGISYLVLPSVFGIIERDETIDSLEGIPTTVVRPGKKWWQWFVR